jgi:hypothetical protein
MSAKSRVAHGDAMRCDAITTTDDEEMNSGFGKPIVGC